MKQKHNRKNSISWMESRLRRLNVDIQMNQVTERKIARAKELEQKIVKLENI